MQYQSDQLDQYLVLCDSLLSLLTQCVRTIQEQEVVYTGYDRYEELPDSGKFSREKIFANNIFANQCYCPIFVN